MRNMRYRDMRRMRRYQAEDSLLHGMLGQLVNESKGKERKSTMAVAMCGTCGLEGGYHDETEIVECPICYEVFCFDHLFEANDHVRVAHNARFLSTFCTVCGETRHMLPETPLYVNTCGKCKYGICEKCGVYSPTGSGAMWFHSQYQDCPTRRI
jgi:hypothetical protein